MGTQVTAQSLREELEALQRQQEEVMRLAIYVGMTADQAEEFDMRRKRIVELYEALLVLTDPLSTQTGTAIGTA